MRDLVYYVAVSLDGFIAGPQGQADGFPVDPATLAELFARYPETCPAHLRDTLGVTGDAGRFDAVIMGARTHAPAVEAGLTSAYPHLRQYVVTHRRLPADPAVEVLSGDVVAAVRELKAQPGRAIWLCGGADIAGQLIDEIDELQLKINPVLFGSGVPLAACGYAPRAFEPTGHEELPGGVLLATYRRDAPATVPERP